VCSIPSAAAGALRVSTLERSIGMDTFGASAPLKQLQKKFGFTCENIVATVKQHIAESDVSAPLYAGFARRKR
jgi:hypothetical protein